MASSKAAVLSGSPSSPSTSALSQPAPAIVVQKPPRILACVLCQHRKIKCDRSFPCANCLKANVTCTPSIPAPARKRRRPNQDLQERLARCEELLKEYATTTPASTPSTKCPSPKKLKTYDAAELQDPLPRWKPAGKLIEEDGGVRFIDSYLLGTVYDELRSMRKIVDEEMACDDSTPAPPADDYSNSPDDNSDMVLGVDTPSTSPEELTPNPSHIIRLWQIYLDRCNPLTKIIHVPTIQPYLLEAIGKSPTLPKNIEALLFAIYTLAVVSMNKEECEEVLGMAREKALNRFSAGVRLTLARLGFLKTNDLFTLQALVIYLVSLQGRYNRHASWILNGIIIRIAQKMGLHRDGERLGLKPFETEMRRRIWWQIIMIDAKYAMLSGLGHTILPNDWDTKEPRNIDDVNLLPSSTEPIKDKEGPTDMIFVLAITKMAKHLLHVPGIETILVTNELEALKGSNAFNAEKLDKYRQVIRELGKDLDQLFTRFSAPGAGSLHELANHIRDLMMSRLSALIKPAPESSHWETEAFDHTRNTFELAICTLLYNVEQHKVARFPAWEWYQRLHFQLEIFSYLVGQLCHRTTGRLVDQAWQVVDDVYEYYTEFFDITQRTYYQLSYFVLKAWRNREVFLHTQPGHALPTVPNCVQKLRTLMTASGDSSVKSEAGKTPNNEIFNFVAGGGTLPGAPDNGGRAVDFNGADGTSYDVYMGNYFDFNGALDFDIWGNTPTVSGPLVTNLPAGNLAGMTQLPNMFPYGMGPSSEW